MRGVETLLLVYKGGIEMKHDATEQGFQELQMRIDRRFGYYFQTEAHQIEYKPLPTALLLEAPSVNRGENPG